MCSAQAEFLTIAQTTENCDDGDGGGDDDDDDSPGDSIHVPTPENPHHSVKNTSKFPLKCIFSKYLPCFYLISSIL